MASAPHLETPQAHLLSHLIAARFSPRSYSEAALPRLHLSLLLEAARQAPSSSNQQPWRFIYAFRGEAEFDAMAHMLTGNNTLWAPKAPLLMLSIAKTESDSGKPNKYALHDTGMATAWLTVQATHMGLYVHQMGGYDVEKARQEMALPAGYDPVAMMAIGYLGAPTDLPEDMREGDVSRRDRKALAEIAFHGSFGQALSI